MFIKGMDVSTLIEEEECGAKYYDGGDAEDLFLILKRHGVNSVRLRLWNDPYSPAGEPYGAGTCDLDRVIVLSERAKRAGMSVLLDFHYSDFWADPGKQFLPKAWADKSGAELPGLVYEYTREVLLRLKGLGLSPFMVQVGNELTNGCLWPYGARDYNKTENDPDTYFNPVLKDVLGSGILAVREVLPDALVMLHLDNGGNNKLYRDWFDGYFQAATGGTPGADFDVIGMSYYPFWHGRLSKFQENINDCAIRYKKPIYLVEVSMGYTMEDYSDYEGLSQEERKGYATKESLIRDLDFPMTADGQKCFMEQIVKILKDVPNNLGMGYYYWEPAWIPVSGCGWATSASLEYIKDKGPCGNEWANQALFDYDGNALPAIFL